MFLRRLESAQAKHVAERSRLFKELADDSEAKSSPRSGPR
jgi:hypothetical protein